MIYAALVIVILALCGLLGFQDYNNRKERKGLINALKAKNASELRDLELAGNTKIDVEPPQDQSNLVSMDDPNMSDEEFIKAVTGTESEDNG